MINVNDIRNGISIKHEGNIYTVLEFQHVKPGKGAAFVKTKMRNLKTGSIIEYTFNSSAKVEQAIIQKKPMQFLYESNNNYIFMDMEDYTQIEVSANIIGENKKFFKENLEMYITIYEGEVIGISLPDKIEFEIVKTEPAVKGNTSSGAMKDAKLDSGYVIKVPIFISEGEKVIVSTEDGKYVSRA